MPLQGIAFEQVPHAPYLIDRPLLEALRRAIPDEAIDAAIAPTGAREQRRRLLSIHLVVALDIALGLWARGPARRPRQPGRGRMHPGPDGLWRLAPADFVLFRRRVGSVASPATSGAFRLGLRLMAIDGTTLDQPNTPENARIFGRPGTDAVFALEEVLLFLGVTATHGFQVDLDQVQQRYGLSPLA